ncbi:MAG: LacI family DNA-binding transcriptional regulator [Parasporobacterium sp.]|nr:LacI family DNA-binding transcriptional regulator [Parasporobacterium sp.]
MKKVIALLIAAVMMLGIASTAMAAETDYAFDGSWPEEQIKIAVEVFDTTDEQFLAIHDYYDYLETCYNIDFIYSESIASAEDEIAFIDSAAAAGCKGLFAFYNVTEAEAVKECAAQGMYYVGATSGDFLDSVIDNEYFTGTYLLQSSSGDTEHNGDYLAGYEMGYAIANMGYQHIAYCEGGASFGVQMFIDRKEGFIAGLEAAGYTNFSDGDVVSGWPGTDDFVAAQTAVISGDYDAVVSSFNVAMWFQPVMESGKEIGLAAIGEANDTYMTFFDMGVVKCIVYDCEETVFGVYVPMLVNAIMGYEDTARDNGKGLVIPVTRWTITEAEQIDKIYAFHDAGNWFVSAEDMAASFKGLNPDATLETYEDVFNVTLDEAMEIAE